MNQKMFIFLTLLLYLLLQSNYIYAQDNFIEVIDNKSIKFSKEGQEKLARVKNQKLYQEPQIVHFKDIEKVIKEKNLEFVLPNYACKLSFTYQSGEYEDSNNYHWYGTLFNEKQKNCYDGNILFVKKEGKVFGTIDIDESSYEFIEIENGYQVLYKINPTEKVICGNENETNPTKNKTKKEEPIDQNTMQRIECLELAKVRILVLYTSAGAASVPNITTTTNLAAQQMRTALSNSSVSKNDLDIEIAAILPFNFIEGTYMQDDVDSLSVNSSVQSLRNSYQADLVVLMAGKYTGNIAGIAKSPSLEVSFENGYSIVSAPYATTINYTFAHEVGHLLGARHEVENDPRGTIEHGYSFRPSLFSAKKSTIMSPLVENHILHYSNPNRYYAGCPLGTTNKNYVAQHFRNTGRQVAAFYPNTLGNFYATIIGSFTPCPWQENWYEADIRCGTPPFNIQWHTSTNGVNYTYKASGEFYLFQAPTQNGTATTIRMTVTGSNGISQTRYIQTTSYSPPNSFSCEGGSNGFRAEEESKIVAKVSPNPIEGKAKLYVELPKEDTQTQILIVDSFGKTIQTLDTSKFIQKGEFDLVGLHVGLYYVSIRSEVNGLHSITIHVK